jgi:2-amino-4-hydroxy-6-hydroxymethyldihydropteridine diphosphokinase
MALVYLGLGSNLGDREEHLRAAVLALHGTPGLRVLRASPMYETEPVGLRQQPWFLNAVLEAATTLPSETVLRVVKGIEAGLGRTAGVRWGPRVIDVDILLYDSQQVRTDVLTIPHAEMWNRRFVLLPLADLRPDLTAPDSTPIGARIVALDGAEQVRRWAAHAWPPAIPATAERTAPPSED